MADDSLPLDPWSGDGVGGVPIGPQSDGTYGYPVTVPAPVDAGGGAAGSYGQSVLDIFKYGVGAYTSLKQSSDLLTYKRYEATQQGLATQGQYAAFMATQSNSRMTVLLLAGAVVLVALLSRKG